MRYSSAIFSFVRLVKARRFRPRINNPSGLEHEYDPLDSDLLEAGELVSRRMGEPKGKGPFLEQSHRPDRSIKMIIVR